MKDLVFLLISLALITFAMMWAQDRYRGQEAKKNEEFRQNRYYRPPTPSPTPTPTPTNS